MPNARVLRQVLAGDTARQVFRFSNHFDAQTDSLDILDKYYISIIVKVMQSCILRHKLLMKTKKVTCMKAQ